MKCYVKDKHSVKSVIEFRLTIFLISISCLINPLSATEKPGLSYEKMTTDAQQIVHVLIINPERVNLKSVHANNKVQGLDTVSTLARQENAIAAINGSFFRMGENIDGLPAGILKIAGRWFGLAYGTRGALGWSNNQDKGHKVLMDRVQTKTILQINGSKFPVNGLNQPNLVSKRRAILYSDAYGNTADSPDDGMDIIIQNDQIIDIVPAGNTQIPKGGYVYSIGPNVKRPAINLQKGMKATVQIKVQPSFKKDNIEDWQTIDNIVGGIPMLIENGRILQDYGQERLKSSFINERHARTAVGIKPSGHWIIAVVEKNQATGSPGMSLPELSVFLQKLGCQKALNLDGGGSSTLYLEGKIINNPENELDENIVLPISRRIGDAILVLPKDEANR